MRISVGHRLYISVMAVFCCSRWHLLFSAGARETIQNRHAGNQIAGLQRAHGRSLQYIGKRRRKTLDTYFRRHHTQDLRVTLIDRHGHVFYDSKRKDYANIYNHSNRAEVQQALKTGEGSTVEKQ